MSLNQFDNSSILLFHSAIKSDKTKECYDNYLRYFKDYFMIKSYDKLVKLDPKKIQTMIQDYVMYERNQNKSAGSINGQLSALKLFFAMNNIAAIN